MKTTKLHVGNVHVQIEKRKNDARAVQTHVDLKKKNGQVCNYRQSYSRRTYPGGFVQSSGSFTFLIISCKRFYLNLLFLAYFLYK